MTDTEKSIHWYECQIRELEQSAGVDPEWDAQLDNYRKALTALREYMEKRKGCEWCRNFAGIPLRGFTPHGCTKTTVSFCPRCCAHIANAPQEGSGTNAEGC